MPDITISTEKPKEEKAVNANDVVETLKKADEYKKLKEENDRLEAEYLRNQELKAKIALGGRALAGQPNEKTPEEKIKEEASEILKKFR